MNEIAVLLPASDIPDGSEVSKRTGTNRFILKEEINVYGTKKEKMEPIKIKGQNECKFLVNDRGSINVVNVDTLLLWHTDTDELYWFLDEYKEGTPK